MTETRLAFAVEPTAIGPQSLVPGVAPISVADRLAWRAAAPLTAKKPQRPLDHGLFDMAARDQLEMFNQRNVADESRSALPERNTDRRSQGARR